MLCNPHNIFNLSCFPAMPCKVVTGTESVFCPAASILKMVDATVPYKETHPKPFCLNFHFEPYFELVPTCPNKDNSTCCRLWNFYFNLDTALENIPKSKVSIVTVSNTYSDLLAANEYMVYHIPAVKVERLFLVRDMLDGIDVKESNTKHLDPSDASISRAIATADVCICLKGTTPHIKTSVLDRLNRKAFLLVQDQNMSKAQTENVKNNLQAFEVVCRRHCHQVGDFSLHRLAQVCRCRFHICFILSRSINIVLVVV